MLYEERRNHSKIGPTLILVQTLIRIKSVHFELIML